VLQPRKKIHFSVFSTSNCE